MRLKPDTRMNLETKLSVEQLIEQYANDNPPNVSTVIHEHLDRIERVAHAKWLRLRTAHKIPQSTHKRIEGTLQEAYDLHRQVGAIACDNEKGLNEDAKFSLQIYEEVLWDIEHLEKSFAQTTSTETDQ